MTGRIPGLTKVADVKREIDRLIEHYDNYMLKDKRTIWLSRDQMATLRANEEATKHFGITEPKLGAFYYHGYRLQAPT